MNNMFINAVILYLYSKNPIINFDFKLSIKTLSGHSTDPLYSNGDL